MGLYLMKSNFTADTHIGENWFWQEQILANFLTNRKKWSCLEVLCPPNSESRSFMAEHWTRSFRNHNACRNCNIHCLQDVETQCIVSNSNYTVCLCSGLLGCRTYNETFTHSLPIPFPWNAERLGRIQFVPFFKSLLGPSWRCISHPTAR